MSNDRSLKEFRKEVEKLNFVNACVTSLNDLKLKNLQDGTQQNLINLSILLKKTDSEMEEFVDISGRVFSGNWWAKIAGGDVNFIQDTTDNRIEVIKMYNKISNFSYPNVIDLVLDEYILINKKNKIFNFKINKAEDFYKKKELDEIAYNLWWLNYFIILVGCHMEPKGVRQILSLKKSLFGKWSKLGLDRFSHLT